ncbi:MAG: sulfite exporter TauE/SafE family protein [Sulfuricurvum sp.]|uniref:sulfite exporter TauE/SafE family protein n=1 Tax=Sulfuricurvum sp. TaxID=2025608 RepID=UPI0026192763|nr:sulfite exporter TauE/SafE family protein [Sulfuricurvum sp.]MDD2367858.1 sulfite exporter TauE/SafE family protein [Sulfuricurvum sp.]MDD5119013.1 sulfite exporter TauE/SafE family protein [Sulfuricurvum sp.]
METITLLSLFIVALSYGATACMLTCMPLLSPILLANGSTRQQSLKVLLPISLGRISGYVFLSLIAYLGATMIKTLISDTTLMGYLLGSVTLILAGRLWFSLRASASCCSTSANTPQGNIALFMTGMFLSMSICAPVVTMMTLSATSTSILWAIAYGLAFGLGATLLWFFFFSVVLTRVLKESLKHLSQYRNVLQHLAPLFLAGVGIAIFKGWIRL